MNHIYNILKYLNGIEIYSVCRFMSLDELELGYLINLYNYKVIKLWAFVCLGFLIEIPFQPDGLLVFCLFLVLIFQFQ